MQNSMQRKLFAKLSTKAPMAAIMPVVDPHTGEVLAMATSKKYGASGRGGTTSLPIFTSYTAQAASTYKLFPLLVALSTGVSPDWQLKTPVGPYQWQSCPPDNGDVFNGDANENYNPGGNLTMRQATVKSSNTFYVGVADQLFGCQLQPIIQMAEKLGINSFYRPAAEPRTDIAQSILNYQSATRLTLGDIETSPLELTAAYAAVANDGRYNAPAPIKSVTANNGDPIRVPRSAGRQVVEPRGGPRGRRHPQGRHPLRRHLRGRVRELVLQHPGTVIAGKTGTAPGIAPHAKKADKNGALWFAGMTPDYAATTALIDLEQPELPGVGPAGSRRPGRQRLRRRGGQVLDRRAAARP